MFANMCLLMCCQVLNSVYIFSMCVFLNWGGVWGDLLASDPADISGSCSTLCSASLCVFLETWRPFVAVPSPWDNSRLISVSVTCASVCVFACVYLLPLVQLLVHICSSVDAEYNICVLKYHKFCSPKFGCFVVVVLGHKTSLLDSPNSIAAAEFNKCRILTVLCDKWHKSGRFLKGEATVWQQWLLVTKCLASHSVPWRHGSATQDPVCMCLPLFVRLTHKLHLLRQVHAKVLTLSLALSPPPFLFLLSLWCPDGGSNSTHAGWEKWHPHPNSEKFSNQDPQCFFR